MVYGRVQQRRYVKKAFTSRYSPYRKGYSKGGRGGFRRYGGYKSRFTSRRFRASPRFVSPSIRGRRVYRPPTRRVRTSASRISKMRIATALAPSGTLTYAGLSTRYDWTSGSQGTLGNSDSAPGINFVSDFFSVLTAAIARVIASPTVATPVNEPKFWIRNSASRVTIVNTHQIGTDVYIYPFVARHSMSDPGLFRLSNASLLEENASSSGLLTNPESVGWTPFQSRIITENFKLGKVRKVHLEGGMSYVYTMRDRRPLYLNNSMLLGSTASTPVFALPWRSRGCYIQARSIPVNETGEAPTLINWGPGALNIQEVRTYEWVASPMPNHYADYFSDTSTLEDISIIQPQTGAVNNAPVSV